jgi:hypothetical protein
MELNQNLMKKYKEQNRPNTWANMLGPYKRRLGLYTRCLLFSYVKK